MLSESDGALVLQRYGRRVVVQRISEEDRYRALLSYQVREAVAAAVAAKLVTIRLSA